MRLTIDAARSALPFLTPVAIAAWTVSSFFLLRHYERVQLELHLERQNHDAMMRDELSQAQLALALLPTLATADHERRTEAVHLLGAVAPRFAERIAPVLAREAGATGDDTLAAAADQVVAEIRTRQALDDFKVHLRNAQTYGRVGRHEQAAREALAAYRVMPAELAGSVDTTVIAAARKSCEEGDFRAGWTLLSEAFAAVPR
jgi:hypothetical protein